MRIQQPLQPQRRPPHERLRQIIVHVVENPAVRQHVGRRPLRERLPPLEPAAEENNVRLHEQHPAPNGPAFRFVPDAGELALGKVRLPGNGQDERVQQPHVRRPRRIRRQAAEPAQQRGQLALPEHRRDVPLEQRARQREVPRRDRVVDRFAEQAEPGAAPARLPVRQQPARRIVPLQQPPEKGREQLMVPEPFAPFAERNEEELQRVQPGQHLAPVRPSRHRVRGFGVHPVQHRRREQERADVRGQMAERLFEQKFRDVPVTPLKIRDEFLPRPQRDKRELQPGDPAFRPVQEPVQLPPRQRHVRHARAVRLELVHREPQLRHRHVRAFLPRRPFPRRKGSSARLAISTCACVGK
ncbi:hypothetical protein SAMN02799624_06048 [Paenibacillus sp. UNC496MF]|nr:hypothetical protein SAMN02799624_06048 [Paenibacillus sp. UNC496MF]